MRSACVGYIVLALSLATMVVSGQTPDRYYTDLSSDLILGFDDNGNAIYAEGGIEMNLALSYQMRGYRHNEMSGWFGMGWTMSGTGAVSRSIMNLPDEFRGYESHTVSELRNNMELKNAIQYVKAIETMQLDAHLDRYSYYCPGGSGSFVILDNEIIQLPMSENEITYTSRKDNSGKEYIDSFTVTTPDGTQYIFAEKEHCHHQYQSMSLTTVPYRYEYDAIITWHLSRIKSCGLGVVNYKYEIMPSWHHDRNSYLDVLNYVQSGRRYKIDGGGESGVCNTNRTTYSDTRILKSISSMSGNVTFTFDTAASADNKVPPMRISEIKFHGTTYRDIVRVKLTGLIGPHGTLNKIDKYIGDELADRWQFNYYGGQIGAYDFFGYCNGAEGYGYNGVIDVMSAQVNSTVGASIISEAPAQEP